jgi:hypothetical protein
LSNKPPATIQKPRPSRNTIRHEKCLLFVMDQSRVAEDVGVAVEGLRRGRVRHQGIGRDESADVRVVVAGIVVIQPQAAVPALRRVAVAGGSGVFHQEFGDQRLEIELSNLQSLVHKLVGFHP